MRILIVSQYFWPENFRINDFALGLKERGHQVEVLTGKPNYPSGKFIDGYNFFNKRVEDWNDIKIHRVPLFPRKSGRGIFLALNYLSFAFFGAIRMLTFKNKYDAILVFEPSPITVGIPAIVLKKRFKVPIYFWVQDLWPESVTAAGGVKNKYVINILNNLTKWIYSHCETILVQSNSFKTSIEKQVEEHNKIEYFPNTVENFFKPQEKEVKYSKYFKNEFNILFAGNIGESQDFETLLETAKLVKEYTNKVGWVILGNGRKLDFVKKKVMEYKLEDVFHLYGSFPTTEMSSFFAWADVLLVSLKDAEIFKSTIPSKVQSYMACGKPILASIGGETDNIIKEANCGIGVEAESPIKLKMSIIELLKLKEKGSLEQLGENSLVYFNNNFEREKLLDKFEDIINE